MASIEDHDFDTLVEEMNSAAESMLAEQKEAVGRQRSPPTSRGRQSSRSPRRDAKSAARLRRGLSHQSAEGLSAVLHSISRDIAAH